MSLFDRIFGLRPTIKKQVEQTFRSFTTYSPVFTSWGGAIYESELVRAAIDAKARHMAKLKVRFEGGALPKLVNYARKRPNDYMTWSQFLYRIVTILEVQNSAIIAPIIDSHNELAGYYPILPSRCEIVTINGIEWLRYHFSSGDCGAVELSRCGILTKHQYKDDFFGDKNTALVVSLEMLDMNTQAIKLGIKNAPKLQFMARQSNFRDEEDVETERKAFAKRLKEDDGAFTLFPNTYDNIQRIKSEPYTVPEKEAENIRTSVMCYFGVSEKVMMNSASADELSSFYDGAIEPLAIQMSEVFCRMTFTDNEQARGARVVLAPDRLQYMRWSEKIAFVRDMSDRGLITLNEGRALLNYDDIDGGDVRPARGEYYFIDSDGNVSGKDVQNGNE